VWISVRPFDRDDGDVFCLLGGEDVVTTSIWAVWVSTYTTERLSRRGS
jgi:hypothetical protein